VCCACCFGSLWQFGTPYHKNPARFFNLTNNEGVCVFFVWPGKCEKWCINLRVCKLLFCFCY
jgi:hypothetical protein